MNRDKGGIARLGCEKDFAKLAGGSIEVSAVDAFAGGPIAISGARVSADIQQPSLVVSAGLPGTNRSEAQCGHGDEANQRAGCFLEDLSANHHLFHSSRWMLASLSFVVGLRAGTDQWPTLRVKPQRHGILAPRDPPVSRIETQEPACFAPLDFGVRRIGVSRGRRRENRR